jgi:hypothetical protein
MSTRQLQWLRSVRALTPLAPMVLLLLASASAEAQIAGGSYVGNGSAGRPVAGVGFRPDVVIVKVDYSNPNDNTCSSGVIRTSTMGGDASKLLHGIPLTSGGFCDSPSTGLIPNLVQSLDASGFTVGSDLRVNAAASACGGADCTYHWVAFKANGDLRLGTYTGNGGSLSITGLAFSPAYVMVLPANNNKAQQRTSIGGTRSDRFDAGGATTSGITSLDADGFSVTNAAVPDNLSATGITYHYVAWNAAPGTTAVGTYAGNGVDNRPIDLPGFQPRYVIVQSITDASGRDAFQRTATMAGDTSADFRGATSADRIQALRPLGFEVGTYAGVNNTGETYAFVAFGDATDDPCSTGGSWWNPAWGRRRRLVFNNSAQAENLTDFPVLIKLDGSRIDYARTQNAGQDLRFVDSDDQTVLAHEIEVWNEAGTSYAWVRVPRINASSASDFIYMYFDNAAAPDGQNGAAVWSNGYRAVWHLKEDPAGAPPQMKDSSGNANHGTAENSPTQTSGQIDGSLAFVPNVLEPDVKVNDSASLKLATDMTVSAWVWTTSGGDGQSRVALAKWITSGSWRNYWLGIINGSTFDFVIDGLTADANVPVAQVNDGQWHHVVGVADAAGHALRLFVDGTQRATVFYDGSSAEVGNSELRIARSPDQTLQCWGGGIDEVRVAGVARTAAWIRAQYLSMSDSFVTFRSEVGACRLRSIGSKGNNYYSAGTVSATNGSWLVTGSGTSWQDPAVNCGRGDRINIDGTDYTILTVTSSTQLRLSSVFTGTSGSGKAYTISRKFTTFQAWENCVDGGAGTCAPFADNTVSLVSDNRSEVGIAYKDSVFALTADVVIDGSTTDATHTITLTADGINRHNGNPGTGVIVDAQGLDYEVLVEDANVTLEWLELRNLGAGSSHGAVTVRGLLTDPAPPKNVLLQNLLIHDYFNSTAGNTLSGIRFSGDDIGKSATIRNTMIWNGDVYGIEGDEASDSLTVDNCSIDNITDNTDGSAVGVFTSDTLNVLVRNTVVTRTGGRDFRVGSGSFSPSSTNNASEDLAGSGGAPGANALTGLVPANVFVAPGSNLHLKTGANVAVDSGVTLSFLTDIDNQVRPAGAWDRGADERDPTTVVELASFGARPLDGAVELDWQTASEFQNLGFHLHRSTSASGPYERITSFLIPGAGSSATGARYSYLDSGLTNGVTYFYELEDVDASSGSTFHGPVSAVPGAAAPSPPDGGGDPGLGSPGAGGPSAPCCPAWVLAAYASPGAPPPTCTRYGDPDAVSLVVIPHGAQGTTLELRTGGFWALREPSGTVRVFVPGFDTPAEATAPALPLRRALVPAVVGKQVHLASVEALDLQGFPSLRPSAVGQAETVVSRDGTVRAGRRPRAAPRLSHGYIPQSVARLAGTVFQGETKSAVVEIWPVRFDGGRQQLDLARLVRVRLAFAGRETDETGTGSLGRLRPRLTPFREVLAQLHTTRQGLHAVRFAELFPQWQRGIPTSLLRLQRQGEAVAFRVEPPGSVFGPGSILYFFVDRTASSTDYTPEIAYELVRSREGQRMGVVAATPDGAPSSSASQAEVSFETNVIYLPHLLEAPDIWLWQMATSGAAPPPPLAFSLAGIDTLAPQAARLVVRMQGGSESGAAIDHHIGVSINGVPVGEASFTGMQPHLLDVTVPVPTLREGMNELSLTNFGDTGVASRVFLDRFSVSYPRLPAASGGVLEGTWREGGTAEVTGVGAAPVVLDVTPAAAVKWLVGLQASVSSVRFRAEGGHRYLVVSRQALLSPRISWPEPSALREGSNQADYLLVAPRAFLAAAQPLLERRESQGLRTRAVSFEEIVDAFGQGRASAEAIHDFLTFAYHSWSRPSPRYVLLLGDSTYDPQRFLASSFPSPLPALWTKTGYLWTAADPALAAVNGADPLPDLAIGRLPATTAEEAQQLVAKLLAWEDSGQDLAGNAVLVADNPDPAGDFEADVEDIRASFLAGRPTQVLKLSELGSSTRAAILDAFNEGASLMSYVGHGGAALWASENVLNSWDMPMLLVQSRQPLLVTMDCLNGYFVAPNYDTLTEALLKAEGRGAIAGFSPSGLSLDGPAHQYQRALMAELTSGRHERLGDAVLAAQRAYAETGLAPELLSVYHLFGDPATRIR